jgi:hypothetical protein
LFEEQKLKSDKKMPNNPIPMIKLRTIIRLYDGQHGLKSIATLSRTSRVTVKK